MPIGEEESIPLLYSTAVVHDGLEARTVNDAVENMSASTPQIQAVATTAFTTQPSFSLGVSGCPKDEL